MTVSLSPDKENVAADFIAMVEEFSVNCRERPTDPRMIHEQERLKIFDFCHVYLRTLSIVACGTFVLVVQVWENPIRQIWLSHERLGRC